MTLPCSLTAGSDDGTDLNDRQDVPMLSLERTGGGVQAGHSLPRLQHPP